MGLESGLEWFCQGMLLRWLGRLNQASIDSTGNLRATWAEEDLSIICSQADQTSWLLQRADRLFLNRIADGLVCSRTITISRLGAAEELIELSGNSSFWRQVDPEITHAVFQQPITKPTSPKLLLISGKITEERLRRQIGQAQQQEGRPSYYFQTRYSIGDTRVDKEIVLPKSIKGLGRKTDSGEWVDRYKSTMTAEDFGLVEIVLTEFQSRLGLALAAQAQYPQ